MPLPDRDTLRARLRREALAYDHPFAGRSTYDLAEFNAFHGEEFVTQAYWAILKRAPDPDGLRTYTEGLRQGIYTKPYILGILARSPEGQTSGVRIAGLERVFPYHRLRCRLLQFLHKRGRLPVSRLRRRVAVLETELAALRERAATAADLAALREAIGALRRDRLALAALLEARVFTSPGPPPAPDIPAAFYAGLEDAFRGDAATLTQGFPPLRPLVEAARARLREDCIALDLGCGRGEWLAWLREIGVRAVGVDLNPIFVARCREAGLEVHEADLMDTLAQQPDASLGLVSAFHVVEHLPFPLQYRLMSEMYRVLLPGGLALLETPNARNLLVTGGDFYRDPTHIRPVFPDTLAYLGTHIGFAPSVAYFYTAERTGLVPAAEATFADLTDYLHVCRDTLWVGVKP